LAHTFTGWSDGSALYQAGSTYTFGASDVTLTAQFSLNGYTKITYSLGTGVGIAPIQASVLEGTIITIASGAQVTRANYAFAGWNDGTSDYAAGDSYVVGPESAPITFTPNWTSGYNVTYSTGSGFGTAPVDSVGRITGSTFTVASDSTVNRQGFTFTGWSDGTSVYAAGATYTVASSNITLTAQWVQNSLAGIASSALTALASFSIVNGVGPTGSFNFGSSSVSYEVPVNALSAGTVISIYGLTDFSSLTGVIPSGKTVISSTVIAWIGTDGTVADTNSPIKMTITDSQIVPGSVVYAVTGNTLQLLGTATTNGSIVTTISSDPVLVIANPVVVSAPTPPSSSNVVSAPVNSPAPVTVVAVVDNSAAIAEANAKLDADKKAADLKAATDKQAAEEAEAAALKAASEMADAQAKAAAELKAAADKAAIELRIAEELRLAQLKAEEELKLAAEKKAAEDAAIAAKAAKPSVSLYSLSSKLTLSSYDKAYLQKYVKSLKNGASVTCIGYSYSKNTTLKKAIALAKSQATAVCVLMKKTNKTLKTSVVVYPATKAPKAAVGAKWVGVSYRVDGFKAP
jgi:pyruvate/2-oxoglutarate dehydrogenase complex dihydrolipoamide acyltransferase (E2) component